MAKLISIGSVEETRLSFPEHCHDFWEIVLYTHGKGVTTVGQEEYSFEPGTILCLPPKIPQRERSPKGYRNYYIICDNMPDFSRKNPVFQDEFHRPFYNITMTLHKEFCLKRSGREHITNNLFDTLILYLSRWSSWQPSISAAEKLEHSIIENLNNTDFQLSDAFEKISISTTHLRRVFKKVTGKTPIEYLHESRINESKHLLDAGGLSIKEIAMRVGLSDQYYFSRLFHKKTGQSPSEYMARKKTTYIRRYDEETGLPLWEL